MTISRFFLMTVVLGSVLAGFVAPMSAFAGNSGTVETLEDIERLNRITGEQIENEQRIRADERQRVANEQRLNRSTQGLPALLDQINQALNTLTPFLVGLAVFVVLWGIFTYITHAADEEKRREAKLFIIWGIIGVFFMVSVWGFINILVNTFPMQNQIPSNRTRLPEVPIN